MLQYDAEDYRASLEMLVCANSIELTGCQETPVNHGQVGVTFSWQGLARTLKLVLGLFFSFPTVASHYQAILFSTNPVPAHQGPQQWVCLRSKLRSLSSHGFCVGLSCWLTWPICFLHQKFRNITLQIPTCVSFSALWSFHCYFKNRALWIELGKGIIHLSSLDQRKTHAISWDQMCFPSPTQKHGMAVGSSLS